MDRGGDNKSCSWEKPRLEMCRINNAPELSAAVVDGDAISTLVTKDGRFAQQATAGMFYWDADREEPHRRR